MLSSGAVASAARVQSFGPFALLSPVTFFTSFSSAVSRSLVISQVTFVSLPTLTLPSVTLTGTFVSVLQTQSLAV